MSVTRKVGIAISISILGNLVITLALLGIERRSNKEQVAKIQKLEKQQEVTTDILLQEAWKMGELQLKMDRVKLPPSIPEILEALTSRLDKRREAGLPPPTAEEIDAMILEIKKELEKK